MSLNIKNEETLRLVRRLAELTGQSQTSAVEDAVRRRIDEIERERERRVERIMEIGRQASAAMTPEERARDWPADLYDEGGLPK
jgi:antitoxin VapB